MLLELIWADQVQMLERSWVRADAPESSSFLRTVSMTWPLRAALVISSSTCLWDLPLTGTPSIQISSSPARRRPSFSAAPSGTMAPMYTCRSSRTWKRKSASFSPSIHRPPQLLPTGWSGPSPPRTRKPKPDSWFLLIYTSRSLVLAAAEKRRWNKTQTGGPEQL